MRRGILVRLRTASIVAAFVLAAGCAGVESKTLTAPMAPPAPKPTFDESTGAIVGTVTDDELVLLPGVDIALPRTNLTVTTDPAGAFTISRLDPGEYTLLASRLGFESVSKRATVVAGESTTLQLVLKPIRVVIPHVESFVDDGYIALAVAGPSFYGTSGGLEGSKTSFQRNATPQAVSAVTAATWDQSTPATAKRLRLSINVDGVSNWTEGKPGLTTRVDELEITKPVKVNLVLYIAYTCDALSPTTCTEDPPNRVAQVVYQQRTKVYTSVFYVDAAPVGFKALPG